MIQIRNVPDELHRELEVRAARAGQSLSDDLPREVGEIASRPTLAEMPARLQRLPPVELATTSADLVREGREHR